MMVLRLTEGPLWLRYSTSDPYEPQDAASLGFQGGIELARPSRVGLQAGSEAAGEGEPPAVNLDLIVAGQADAVLVGLGGGGQRRSAVEPRHVWPAHVPESVKFEEDPEGPPAYEVHKPPLGPPLPAARSDSVKH